jgi:integrase/recombinase XerC
LLDSDSFKNDFRGVLQKTIITFFYFTGVRRIELIKLKESDINMDSSTIKIMGKRSKERIIPMLPVLKKSIVDYLNIRSQEFNKKILNVFLFLGLVDNFQKNMFTEQLMNTLNLSP